MPTRLLAFHADSSLVATADDCKVSVLLRAEATPQTCCRLAAPVAWLRWRPGVQPALLAADVTGAAVLCARRTCATGFSCVARFPATDALRAVEWLHAAVGSASAASCAAALPFGTEGFLTVGACGTLALRWRPAFGADAADASAADVADDAGDVGDGDGAAGTCALADVSAGRPAGGWGCVTGSLGGSDVRAAALCEARENGVLLATTAAADATSVAMFLLPVPPTPRQAHAATRLAPLPLRTLGVRARVSQIAFVGAGGAGAGAGPAWAPDLLVATCTRSAQPAGAVAAPWQAGLQLWRPEETKVSTAAEGKPSPSPSAPAARAAGAAAAPSALALDWRRVCRLCAERGTMPALPPAVALSTSAAAPTALMSHAGGRVSIVRCDGPRGIELAELDAELDSGLDSGLDAGPDAGLDSDAAVEGSRKRRRPQPPPSAPSIPRPPCCTLSPNGLVAAALGPCSRLLLTPLPSPPAAGAKATGGVAGEARTELVHAAVRCLLSRVPLHPSAHATASHPWDVFAALCALPADAALSTGRSVAAALEARLHELTHGERPPQPKVEGVAAKVEGAAVKVAGTSEAGAQDGQLKLQASSIERPESAAADAPSGLGVGAARAAARLRCEGPRLVALLAALWGALEDRAALEGPVAGSAAAWRLHLGLWLASELVGQRMSHATGGARGVGREWEGVLGLLSASSALNTAEPAHLARLAAPCRQLFLLLLPWLRAGKPGEPAGDAARRAPPRLGAVLPHAAAVLLAARVRLDGHEAGGFSVAQIRALYAAAVRRLELESAAGHASRRGEAGAVAAEVADLGTWVEWEVARLGRLLGASPADRGEERTAADGGAAASDDAAATMLKAHRALARWAGA